MRSSSACINSSTAISDHLFSAARYGGHYLYRAVVGNVRGGPIGPSHHFTVNGDGYTAWFNRESL
jgi:hypothetical protein